MKRRFAFVAAAVALACSLWLLAAWGLGEPTEARAQQGQYALVFQQGVSPSGYDGTADTHMDFYSPSKNEGGRTDFGVTFDDKKRSLFRFDVSQHVPSGARVLSATLTLHVNSRTASSAIGLTGYRVLQPWSESEATWQQAQEGVGWWGGPGCDGASRSSTPLWEVSVNELAKSSFDLDLTSVVQYWVDHPEDNHGVLLVGRQVGSRVTYYFCSSEYTSPGYRPRLEIVYEGQPPLATPTPTSTPTKTPTPPNPTTIYSTLSDWKFDQCMKTGKDANNPPAVRTSPVESMLIQWEGTVYTAKLHIVICQTNPGAEHPIYLNGHLVAHSPPGGTTGCECNQFPILPEHQFEIELDPGIVLQGMNYISITNEADPYEEWKASRAQIELVGNITGTTRHEFELGIDWEDRRLRAAMQLPMGYDPNAPRPLLISMPGTGEDRLDGLNRFAIEANEMGWLLASLDKRHVRWSAVYEQVARSASLAVQQDVLDLVDYMQAHYSVDPSRIYIAGFSTGGGAALTLAAKYPTLFAGVLDYSGPSDYAQWYAERPDLATALQFEFSGGPQGNFEYPRRSSRWLARNLQYMPMRIRHSVTGDTAVPFAQSQNLMQAMAQYYDPSAWYKELITHTLGHADPNSATKLADLEFLSQFTVRQSAQELHIATDEGKDYFWLDVAKADTADRNWQGGVEIDVRYDASSGRIDLTAKDGEFAEGRPLTVTLDLGQMGLAGSTYAVEEYDWQTGDFAMYTVSAAGGKLTLTVPRNALGSVGREYAIYPPTGRWAQHVSLQQNLDGYAGAEDTYITAFASEGSSVPHGDASSLLVGYDKRRKALMKFDLGSIPDGSVIKAARLTVHLLETRTVPLKVGVYEARRFWEDQEATWDLASQGQAWAAQGAEGVGVDRADIAEYVLSNVAEAGPYVFNLKSLVERWLATPALNHGVMLIGEGPYASASYPWASAENSSISKRPLLDIWYMEPTGDCVMAGHVTLQGRPPAPHPSWSVPLAVTVGAASYSVTTDQWGDFSLSGLTPGTYDIGVKNRHTLRNLKSSVTLLEGTNNIDLGTLLEGDANDDNQVNISDFSLLRLGFAPGYDERVDFNEDGVVSIHDFSLLAASFGEHGDIAVD